MKRLLAGMSALAALLSSCAPADNVAAPVAKSTAVAVKPNGRIDANPGMWAVKDADTTIYLFGTVHVLRPNVDWFDGAVRRAYDASGDLVLEVVPPDPAATQSVVMKIAVDPDGPPLTRKLSEALRPRYIAAMTKAELPYAGFETLEPWFVASLLGLVPLEKLGYSAESGAEAVLLKAAKTGNKPLVGLETFEQQLGFFDNLAEPLQIRFLASTIDEMADAEKTFGDLIESWTKGDTERLGALMNEGMRETSEIAKVLLADRNARWAQWIDDRLDRPGTSFVAVGAGHLAGADSVQAMLARRGITATRVQ